MLKKVVGAIATLSFMIGTLGMGYPHESESQQENAYLVYSEAVTSRMSEETHSSAQTVSRIQAQGARSIARYAKEEAHIQEAAMPLVMSRIEASKRKTSGRPVWLQNSCGTSDILVRQCSESGAGIL